MLPDTLGRNTRPPSDACCACIARSGAAASLAASRGASAPASSLPSLCQEGQRSSSGVLLDLLEVQVSSHCADLCLLQELGRRVSKQSCGELSSPGRMGPWAALTLQCAARRVQPRSQSCVGAGSFLLMRGCRLSCIQSCAPFSFWKDGNFSHFILQMK